MYTSYRVTVLVVLVTSTVTSQGLFGKQGSPPETDDSVKSNKDAGAFSEAFWEKIRNPDPVLSPVTLSYNTSTKSALYSVVLSRFIKEMEFLFVTLPMDIQCRELLKVSKRIPCNSAMTLHNSTALRMNVSKCSWHEKDQQQSKTCNRTAVVKVFEHQMGQVFESLPWPFKCNIVNLVAQTYRVRNKGNTGQPIIPVKDTEDAIEKIFSFIHIGEACSKAKQDIYLPQVSLVYLKVELKNGTTKKSWLKDFKTKGPQLYHLYLTYQQKSVDGRPLIGSSIRKTLINDVPLSQIYVTKVSDGMPQFSVIFGLKIKKKGQYREMKSSHKIMKSLRKAKAAHQLNAILHAKVLQIGLKKEQVAIPIPEHNHPKTWTIQEMNRARRLFPKNMTDYYKCVGHIERCFIMFWISSSLGRNPAEMEQFLNALNLVIRRHSCYYTKRDGPGNMTVPDVETEKRREPILLQTADPLSKDTYAGSTKTSTPYAEGQDQDKEPVEEDSEISSLEYALFTLLGLLCVATLAFTINYALFALKRSPNRTNRHLPKEVCKQNAKSKRGHCVHVTHKDQNMAKQGQLPYSSTGSSLGTIDSGKPHTNHPTKAIVQIENPGVTGSDSGYPQSREVSCPCHDSVISRDLHSETQLCNQICSHSKSLEPRTELSSEAKTSEMNTTRNPDDSVEVALCSDSSNILSPSPETERCQQRLSKGDSEISCIQSYTTVSPADPCETHVHVMIDHCGFKEVQV